MKQSQWTVYCHIHIESGRRYVGLTKKTWKQRWNQHVYTSTKLSEKGWSHFANAIRKYGKDAFSHEILEKCDTLELANAAEISWIEHFDTRNPKKGFNLSKGGDHIPHPVKNPWDRPEFRAKCSKNISFCHTAAARAKSKATLNTPESKAKRSAATKAAMARPEVIAKYEVIRADPAYRDKISRSAKAALASPEVRARMSEASKNTTDETKKKISASLKIAMSKPETKKKLSAASKATWSSLEYREKRKKHVVSQETKAKISKASKGKKHSPEAIARMSKLARERWADPKVRAAHNSGIQRSQLSQLS